MIRRPAAILTRNTFIRVAALAAVASVASQAQAQWTVRNVHPAEGTGSGAGDIRGAVQVGPLGAGGSAGLEIRTGTAPPRSGPPRSGPSRSGYRAGLPAEPSHGAANGRSNDGLGHYAPGSGLDTLAGGNETPPRTPPLSPVAVLIDNLAEPLRDASPISTGAVDLWAAQSFRTDARSYELLSIDTKMGNLTGGAVFAELRIGDDPTGPLVTTLTAGPVPGVGLGAVTLTPDTRTVLDGLTRYFLVVYGPEGTAFDWAYAEGNNYVGPGLFDTFWYTSDRGLTWADFGGENPFFLRVNVGDPRAAALIDNLAELLRAATTISTGAVDLWAAQSFRTDARPYELLSIDTTMGNLAGGAVVAELRTGDDPTGPLVTTLTAGPVPGVGLGAVTLTPDSPTVLDGLTRYFLVLYGPEGTAFDWAYAEGNNYVGPGFFDNYWYTSDRGVTWADFGGENPYFLRVNVADGCPEGQRTDSSCVLLTDTGGDPQLDVLRGACDAAQSGPPVDVITGDVRGLTETGGVVLLPRSTCVADDAPFDRVTVTNVVSAGCSPAVFVLARRGLSEQSDWGTASSGAPRLGGEGACP